MNRIRELREEMGVKQAWLAEKLHVGQAAVSNYELGTRDPSAEMVQRLCAVFDCSADYLLCLSDERRSAIRPEEAAMLEAFRAAPYTVQTAITVLLSPYMKGKNASAG